MTKNAQTKKSHQHPCPICKETKRFKDCPDDCTLSARLCAQCRVKMQPKKKAGHKPTPPTSPTAPMRATAIYNELDNADRKAVSRLQRSGMSRAGALSLVVNERSDRELYTAAPLVKSTVTYDPAARNDLRLGRFTIRPQGR